MYKIFRNIPSDWQACKFGDLISSSQNGMYKHLKYYGKGTPIIRITDFDKEGNFVSNSFQRVVLEKNEVTLYKLDSRNILINRVNSLSHIGKVAFIEKLFEPTVFESNMIRIVVNENKLLPEYAFLYLLTDLAIRQFRRKAKRAVAQASINQKDIRSIIIGFPRKINEQQKIIQIYNNLNKIIISTQKIIEQLQIIRNGLMQYLFTQGIGHTEFKETKLGKIPKEWNLIKLVEVSKIKAGGNAPQGEKYFENGKYPFVRVQHFNGERLFVDKWDLINKEAIEKYRLELFPKNSIIFPKSGAAINLEKRALLPNDCYIVGHLCVIIPNKNVINEYFLFYYLKKLKLSRYSAGTTLPYLNLDFISKIIIPLPSSSSEQGKISNILLNLDKKIENEQNYLKKLKEIKKGLMQDLLIGKRRVKREN